MSSDRSRSASRPRRWDFAVAVSPGRHVAVSPLLLLFVLGAAVLLVAMLGVTFA